ncbi:MAG: gamma-glutamyltransferase, partial [Candidatus Tectomicrobia bacterium]|nr:gamma-glutamyltransferase [Candidatus Tectomicrobia bacterium]
HKGRHEAFIAARDFFYKGEIAEKMVKFSKEQGAFLSMRDMEEFHVQIEEPVRISYKEYEVYSCGPWCQGPVVPQTLKLLEEIDLKSMEHNSTEYIHTVTEALKLVFADREKYYGDPEFVRVPIKGLMSKEYARERQKQIHPNSAWPEMPPFGNPWVHEGIGTAEHRAAASPISGPAGDSEPDTSYVCAVDKDGNAFSATPSDSYSNTPVVPGTGLVISPRGSQTWLDPDHASGLKPWKRPRLTPNPAMVLKNGKLFMPFGTPGGDTQCQSMVQMFLNIIEFGMTPQEAIEAPRFMSHSFPNSFWPHRYNPGRLDIESRIPERVRAALQEKGHKVEERGLWSRGMSGLCAITYDPQTGVMTGGADPRREGYVVGW